MTWEVKVQELEQRLSEAAATRPSEMNFFCLPKRDVEETFRSKYVIKTTLVKVGLGDSMIKSYPVIERDRID